MQSSVCGRRAQGLAGRTRRPGAAVAEGGDDGPDVTPWGLNVMMGRGIDAHDPFSAARDGGGVDDEGDDDDDDDDGRPAAPNAPGTPLYLRFRRLEATWLKPVFGGREVRSKEDAGLAPAAGT